MFQIIIQAIINIKYIGIGLFLLFVFRDFIFYGKIFLSKNIQGLIFSYDKNILNRNDFYCMNLKFQIEVFNRFFIFWIISLDLFLLIYLLYFLIIQIALNSVNKARLIHDQFIIHLPNNFIGKIHPLGVGILIDQRNLI